MGRSEGSGTIESPSTLSPEQQELLRMSADFIKPRIGTGATALPFDAAEPIDPSFDRIFTDFMNVMQDPERTTFLTDQLRSMASGESFYEEDIAGRAQEFEDFILTPATRILTDIIGRDTSNAFNQPGRLFASDVNAEIGERVGQQIGLSAMPLFQQTLEGERNRAFSAQSQARGQQLQGLQMFQQLPGVQFQQASGATLLKQDIGQRYRDVMGKDFLRLAEENDPWLMLALGVATQPTVENLAFTDIDRTGQLLGAGSTIAAAALA